MESAGSCKEIADAIASGVCVTWLHILRWFCHFSVSHIRFNAGKWYRRFFTNGDILELLSVMSATGCEDPRKMLHTIVTSRVETRMSQYRLYEKALRVQSQIAPRKSRRKQQRSLEQSGNQIILHFDCVNVNCVV